MNLQDLQDFIYNTKIPEEKNQIGFLEITGKAHHENTNSAVYPDLCIKRRRMSRIKALVRVNPDLEKHH